MDTSLTKSPTEGLNITIHFRLVSAYPCQGGALPTTPRDESNYLARPVRILSSLADKGAKTVFNTHILDIASLYAFNEASRG